MSGAKSFCLGVTGNGITRQHFRGSPIQLICKLFKTVPRDRQRRRDDENHGCSEQQLTFSRQGYPQPSNLLEHLMRF